MRLLARSVSAILLAALLSPSPAVKLSFLNCFTMQFLLLPETNFLNIIFCSPVVFLAASIFVGV
jgi:hypothetical protein